MKQYLHHLFEFMGKPENFRLSVLIVAVIALTGIAIGMVAAWVMYLFINKKDKPLCFDDLISGTNYKMR